MKPYLVSPALLAALSLSLAFGGSRPAQAQQGLSVPLQTLKVASLDNLDTEAPALQLLQGELQSTLGRAQRGRPLSQERALRALTVVCSYGYALHLVASGKPRREWEALSSAFREELERTLKSKSLTLAEQDLRALEAQSRELLSLLHQLMPSNSGGTEGRGRGRANSTSTARKKDDESKDIKESSGGESGAGGGSGGSSSIKPGSGSTIPKGHSSPGLKTQVSIKIQQHAVALEQLMK